MSAVDSKKTTKNLLIFYITIATMHCMQCGISLQRPMVRMHVMVLVGQLNEWLLMQACSDLSPKCLFEFANSEIPGIQSFWVPTAEIIENKHLLEKRFEKSSTLPGSNFVIHDLKIGDYVACTYDFDW